ncbi:ABC transporter permease [Blastococcus sp. MG754426]|uniref:galactan export ABC transporter permease subunit Wzm/RfbD n=1 Tax=unclassified Blastococcus TaxID=2619396 RepID=UPI001EF03251|nr:MULTISPECIES: ABC transporter permease [unclassified Blastococcus]MCF6507206.1 ABC transporter permease [Blastococcus sp. MG754426]MCF6513932.1 ABC transporter permease [Blastococcus sp. MG754427]MCF6735437.1 ABC transporter permease [Blastococcus sp. KM273129]
MTATAPEVRSWRRAAEDLRVGWQQRQLWGHLAWQDIRQRYRRSVLGPIWISISMAVTAVALGVLYAGLFGNELSVQLPYILVGFIVWAFISGCITEGADVFISNEGLIKQLPAPLSVHVYRLVWRQTLFFFHNLAVYVVMLLVFPQPLTWRSLTAFAAFALLAVNGAWVALLFGIVTTRFRDLTPITQSIVQLMFFLTPIVWIYGDLVNSPNPAIAERARLVEFNPFLHYIEIIRQPMLGQDQVLRHWIVVLVLTVVGWALTLIALRRYRARISYWV